ncbi:MAG: type 1 glutamine amidotransferase domain-containing protein [Candidatus Pelagadaptatus aseana]|uniref:type 1 glutamine amidotransferase domain-containing protein n=1 Tax=Candidatus Pelagadaptatus aseana TaxID=3120508 RepID=UPI0039B239D4
MKNVLILVTNHATLGDTDSANGTYAPELTHVLHELNQANCQYDIASIQGGNAPLYGTDAEHDPVNDAVLADDEFQNRIRNTIPYTQISADKYDAVFYPGGFGLLSDLASHEPVARLSAAIYEQGGAVAAVCHGPAGLLPITLSDGSKLIDGKRVTAFTREEEVDFGTINDIPFLLEEALTRNAGRYEKTGPWQENVIVDGRVITGQNPQSAHGVGVALVKLLGV